MWYVLRKATGGIRNAGLTVLIAFVVIGILVLAMHERRS